MATLENNAREILLFLAFLVFLLFNLLEGQTGRATFQPGWRWSLSVKPLAGTKSCEAPHLQYHVSGHLHVVMDDGSEDEFGPGDVSLLPPGHDAWVVGKEPVVVVDVPVWQIMPSKSKGVKS